MKKKYDADRFLFNVMLNVDKLELESDFPSMFYDSYYRGKREISQKQEILSKRFDIKWIETIESYLNSLNIIARTVKSNLKYESEVVPVELARNISSESVVHLTSHTENIKEITEEGVIPQKILTNLSEIEYGIYENRFIMTLILRLRDFVNERVKIIKENLSTTKKIDFKFDSTFIYEEANYQISLNINQEEASGVNKITEYNNHVYERAEKLLRLINRLYRSPFMELMKGYNKVVPPIMKTQVILKNPHFKNAYLLWLFLDKNQNFEFDVENETSDMLISGNYDYALNKTILLMFSNLLLHDGDKDDGSEIDKSREASRKDPFIKDYSKPIIEVGSENIELEEIGLNEYFLGKAREIFKQEIERNMEVDSDYKISLKKALRDTMGITNALYASFFEIDADEDIFRKLVRSEDPMLAYEEAKKKHDIAKTIRQEKERDYLEAIELEKKWATVLAQKQEKLIEYEEKKIDELVTKFINAKKEEFEKVDKEIENDLAKDRQDNIDKHNDALRKEYNDLKEKLEEERRRIENETTSRTDKALGELNNLHEEKRRKMQLIAQMKQVEDMIKYKDEKSKLKVMYERALEVLIEENKTGEQSAKIKDIRTELNKLANAEAKAVVSLKLAVNSLQEELGIVVTKKSL
ncbi:MAG: DUF2357 domain-containing protein [Bacilli bacterium]